MNSQPSAVFCVPLAQRGTFDDTARRLELRRK
jgi:hypothetical protein